MVHNQPSIRLGLKIDCRELFMLLRETLLAKPAAEWLRKCGCKVYAEVRGLDLLGINFDTKTTIAVISL